MTLAWAQASILAANINNVEDEEIILDKTFLSLGIDKGDGIMEIIIPRNTKIPFEKTITLKSINDSLFDYKIYEGERKLVKYNKLLGECKLDNISQIKKGKEIEINFSMDINYILFITIKEIGNDNENTIEIQYNYNRLEE